MKSLKTKLQFNYKYVIVFLILFIYVLCSNLFVRNKSFYNIKETQMVGIVKNINIDGNKISMLVEGKEKVLATIYFNSLINKEEFLKNVSLGDKLKLYGNFEEPKENTIFKGFNYKKYLKSKKIYLLFNVNDYKVVKKRNVLYMFKDLIFKRINKMPNSDYLQALILGNKNGLSQDITNNYQKNGISHLLAISGMHLNTYLLIVGFLLRRFKKNIRYLVTFFFLLFLLFLTNFSASILRAVLFLVLNIINKELELNYNNLQILFLTAGLILIVNPLMIRDVGFIYSFVVTFGIIYNQKRIKGNYFKKILIISFIAFIYSLPITALLNYEVNIFSIFINLVFVPFISLIIYPLVLLNFLFSFISPFLSFLLHLGNEFNAYLTNYSFMINIPRISWIFILSYYLILFLPKDSIKLLLIIILLLVNMGISHLDSSFYVYYFDVSQGDSAVIVFPHKSKVIMIDTGGIINYETEEWKKSNKNYKVSNNVIKYLKSIGITKIDYLILTHGDYDHMGDSINLVDNYKVENVIFNCGGFNDLESELVNVLNKKNIKYYSCIKKIVVANYKLKFLNTGIYNDENTNSSVIFLNYKNYKFLFMGDASLEREKDILDKYKINNIDVLKAGHHGSKTSSGKEFIDKIRPKYSVISVGKNNRYGHPNKEVLNILDDSKIYRTDKQGSIVFKIKNDKSKIDTCSP